MKSLEVEYFRFDNETVTAKDYTMEINLTQLQCENVLRLYDGNEGVSPGLRLKLSFMKCIEDELYKSGFGRHRVANVELIYETREIILTLKKRGDAIVRSKVKETDELNKQLSEYIRKKADKEPNSKHPEIAFIIMETEDGYTALKSLRTLQIADQSSPLKEADEPTNIIWEGHDRQEYTTNILQTLKLFSSIFVLVITVVAANYLFNSITASLSQKYDTRMCDGKISLTHYF